MLWDRATNRIVSNDFPEITIQLDTEFQAYGDPSVQLYPEHLRAEIDEVNARLYRLVDYPNLWPYARDLFQRPGFGDTLASTA